MLLVMVCSDLQMRTSLPKRSIFTRCSDVTLFFFLFCACFSACFSSCYVSCKPCGSQIKGARNTLRAQRIILEEFRLFSCLGDTELHTQIEREFSEFCADARDDEELIQYLSEVAQHPEAEEINWEGLLEEERKQPL